MEDITLTMILFAVGYVAQQAVVILWLKSDLKKHEKKHEDYVKSHSLVTSDVKSSITELYNRTNNTMTRIEITQLVKECIGELKEDIDDIKDSSNATANSMHTMREDLIRIDERYKAMNNNNKKD